MIDMTNQEYRNWVIIKPVPKPESQKTQSKSIWWLCRCKECGFERAYNGTELRANRVGACRHSQKKRDNSSKDTRPSQKSKTTRKGRIKDEVGNTYGKLTVISFSHTSNSHAYWNCQCECGKITVVKGNALRNGAIHSCGCLGQSYMEYVIAQVLSKNEVEHKQEFSFIDLRDKGLLRFDFAIFDRSQTLKGLIEYQGRQHYDANDYYHRESLIKHDNMKVEYCQKNNIPLLILDKENYSEKLLLDWVLKICK